MCASDTASPVQGNDLLFRGFPAGLWNGSESEAVLYP